MNSYNDRTQNTLDDMFNPDWFPVSVDPPSMEAQPSDTLFGSSTSNDAIQMHPLADDQENIDDFPPVQQLLEMSTSSAHLPIIEFSNSPDIDRLIERSVFYDGKLLEIERDQSALLLRRTGNVDLLIKQQFQLHTSLFNESKFLDECFSCELLTPKQLLSVHRLRQSLKVQSAQLGIYQEELRALTNPNPAGKQDPNSGIFARLCISMQPLTGVIAKAKAGFHASILVRLLAGVTNQFRYMSEMNTGVIFDDPAVRHQFPSTTKFLEQDSAPLEVVRCQTIWHHRFVTGTRKKLAYLQYSLCLGITEPQPQIKLRSELSRPFIVITNDCQWHEAEAASLQNTLFSRVGAVPWLLFVNTVHSHFIAATRQDPEDSVRPIYPIEWAYFRQTFFENGATVSAAQFQTFWDWFGKCVQKLRYQPQLLPLFRQGCLSFLPKRSSLMTTRMLQQPPGTFCLRFSESVPGKVAVAYRASSKPSADSIRHYLPQIDEGAAAKSPLADFLIDQPSLTHIFVSQLHPRDLFFQVLPKEDLLEPLCSKKQASINPAGYDTSIHITPYFDHIE